MYFILIFKVFNLFSIFIIYLLLKYCSQTPAVPSFVNPSLLQWIFQVHFSCFMDVQSQTFLLENKATNIN